MIWIVLQVIAAKAVLLPLARVLDNVFWGHPVLLLYFVMIMCPLVMNIIQVRIASLFPIKSLHAFSHKQHLSWLRKLV